MTSPVSEQTAEWQQEEERQEEDVPTADDEDRSSEHEPPECKAHGRAQRSSVYGSRLPDLANPRLSMYPTVRMTA
jgi:hypothetical protein